MARARLEAALVARPADEAGLFASSVVIYTHAEPRPRGRTDTTHDRAHTARVLRAHPRMVPHSPY
eukprot:6229864-Prymnesium_polylepis.1